ncbi:ABC-2 type transport system ATP-binding protein [Paenibacillus cellulosilyticus]|uniref:ABC-2 type transport system ATP-binding protein n=1 Tax=Paenibacillus cellulosilyticus TaxID=375489 RepID=A0A2V2YCE5_9BACL|nr:ABC transporter ATP-binding protein [Paenibacillus cellulosilyticus]PWV89402.1 ABC-2 type transport system ATP-binding protein [Paenibacillus cellulosilyticus]QKS43150.1 ABC transporter ATP-binding protein [Paenibacillus cellulosilyticus]
MIELIDVKKRFGLKKVLQGVSFTAPRGAITCLTGLNGAGKTTILKAIMGLTPIQSGTIRIDGSARNQAMYERMVYVSDQLTMPGRMKIADCFSFMKEYYRNWNSERANELLARFQLNPADKVNSLSKGTAAKLNLLMGLAMDADYMLLDEPFSGVDLFSREEIAAVFSSEMVEGRGIILTTHEIREVEHLLDYVVMLDHGRITKQFASDDMRMEEGKSVVDVMREVYKR